MKAVKIGEIEFKSSKSAMEYVRSRLNEIGDCTIPQNHHEYPFLMSLITNHPECAVKIGSGIRSFTIQPNPLQMNSKHITFKRVDGSNDVLSWRQCSGMKPSKQTQFYQLFREAVKDHIQQLKVDGYCADCGTIDDLHVHHHGTPFKKIVDEFNVQYTLPCKDYVTDIVTGRSMFKDPSITKSFADYHKTNCDLVVVCQKCHINRHKLIFHLNISK